MVDPDSCTRYDLNQYELEEFLLFSVLVAGKTARFIAKALDGVLRDAHRRAQLEPFRPFKAIKKGYYHLSTLQNTLKKHGIGCHTLKGESVWQLVRSGLALESCSVADLEAIRGIGPKTARFFILHTREGARVAALDTHILKYMRECGYEVPKSTPGSRKQYRLLEEQFLGLADASGQTVADFDLSIWKKYSKSLL